MNHKNHLITKNHSPESCANADFFHNYQGENIIIDLKGLTKRETGITEAVKHGH